MSAACEAEELTETSERASARASMRKFSRHHSKLRRASGVEEQLTIMREATEVVQRRVIAMLLGTGFLCFLIGCFGWGRFFAVVPPEYGPTGFWWFAPPLCLMFFFMALLPTAERAVRFVRIFLMAVFAVIVFPGCCLGGLYVRSKDCSIQHFSSSTSCDVFLVWFEALGILGLVFLAVLCRASKESVRGQLRAMWLAMRIFLSGCGAIFILAMLAIGLVDERWRSLRGPGADAHHPLDLLAWTVCGVWWLALMSASTPTNRDRWLVALRRLASHGQGAEAAVVATLVSKGGSPAETLAMARRSFLGLPCDALTVAHLRSSGDSGLHALTRHCAPHGVDAFVSHSWHDAAAPKMRAIELWRGHHGQSGVLAVPQLATSGS